MTAWLRAKWLRLGEVVALLLAPPSTSRKDRFGRRALDEVTIYLGDDNMIFVQHLCMEGHGKPEVAIRMCWEAMQHLAMVANLGINLPTQAAVPVEITRLPARTPVPVGAENGTA